MPFRQNRRLRNNTLGAPHAPSAPCHNLNHPAFCVVTPMTTHLTYIRGARFSTLAFTALAICASVFAALPAPDEAAIRAATKKLMEYGIAGDWSNFSSIYSEDAILMWPNRQALNGRKAILD